MESETRTASAPIDKTFPIEQVNAIADKESTGFGRRHYRPIYTIHKWWARRLGSVFRAILLYSLADDDYVPNREHLFHIEGDGLWPAYFQDVHFDKVVLDPMMGGGTTIVEALRFGTKVVGCDLNPVAWFVVKKEVEPLDLEAFRAAYVAIADAVKDEIAATYATDCPKCEGEAEGMYFFWVKELPCPNCREAVPLFSDYKIATGPKEDGKTTRLVYCPNCNHVVTSGDWSREQSCPDCRHVFNPAKSAPVSGATMTCPNCGQKSEIVETVRHEGRPEERLFSLEYYCSSCDETGYKHAEAEDTQRFESAAKVFSELEPDLTLPDANIPIGAKTKEPLNHGYKNFRDMFNPRQLLNLGKILREIEKIEDENIQEFMLLAFSNSLKYNCMFAKYNRSHNFVTDLFRTHAFHPSHSPVEVNCFDLPKGMGSFRSFVDIVIEAKEWCQRPFDRTSSGDKVYFETPVFADPILSADEGVDSDGKCLLLAQSSEYLGLPDKCVDAVITDPPYLGNVNYAELADFFYVWLRLVLKDRYPHFKAEYSPKRTEVIENDVRGKTTEDFVEGLTAVFEESHRLLRDEGVLAFTFHHRETDAWASVLQSVLDAGFYVTAIYPVRAEMAASTHIYAKGNIEYDMIIVCRKRVETAEPRSWRSIEDQIYFRVEEIVHELEESQKQLSPGDLFAVTMGKCLEIYSKYYPNVMRDDEPVSIQEALSQIPAIVDGQISQSRYQQLVAEFDHVTALYLSFVIGRGKKIPYGELNMELQQRNLNIKDLLDVALLEQDGSDLRVLTSRDRAAAIESKGPLDLDQIDRAHFLHYLSEHGNLARDARKWATPEALNVMSLLSQSLTDRKVAKKYGEVAEHVAKLMAWET